jgi:galactose mutarotase-like enzyme
MQRHGFARDLDFKLINKTDTKVTFALEDSPETHRCYPYRFMLSITYRLDGNKIHIIWHVHNTETNEIHFQIGGHPAFMIPGMKEGDEVKGTIRFDNTGNIERLIGNMKGCIIPGRFDVGSKDGIWHFNEDSFKEDCVIIDKSQVKQVALLDESGQPVVTLDMKTPCVGIWAPYGKHAPFVCIEPWYGIHDKVEYSGDFQQKYLMNHLQPGASFLSEYTIAIK